jgi:antitoxin component of RelBE/YafQ-DinJ toxin-antitoxin module
MELFKLLGTIAINNAEALKALRQTSSAARETGNAVQDSANDAERSSSRWGGALKKIGSGAVALGKTVAVGIGAAATALGGLTIKALSSAGELEQNMGGSEAVFAEHADKIQAKAKEAFSNMGLSTSDYLATANKMGALFKGAGFETQEALDLSSNAMQRAADVASIMGIDTASAMEAVAGAAKGNFTMIKCQSGISVTICSVCVNADQRCAA